MTFGSASNELRDVDRLYSAVIDMAVCTSCPGGLETMLQLSHVYIVEL